jgi:hypothetical protein
VHPEITAQLLRWLAVMEHLTDCRSFDVLRCIIFIKMRILRFEALQCQLLQALLTAI